MLAQLVDQELCFLVLQPPQVGSKEEDHARLVDDHTHEALADRVPPRASGNQVNRFRLKQIPIRKLPSMFGMLRASRNLEAVRVELYRAIAELSNRAAGLHLEYQLGFTADHSGRRVDDAGHLSS